MLAAAQRRRLPGHDADRRVAQLGSARLKWGKEQGGVVGFSHSGWGLQVRQRRCRRTRCRRFDGIGANEYIVDVVHDVCDFISAVDTPFVWEMNIWYHTLNCGYTTSHQRRDGFSLYLRRAVGLGRSYVKLMPSSR